MNTYSEKRKLKAAKAKKYKNKKAKGEILYATPSDRLKNTESDRGKRRYGFRRISSIQKHRKPSWVIDYHRSGRNKNIKCYKFYSYLNFTKTNEAYASKDIMPLFAALFSAYNNIENLLEDYSYGFRDPLFAKLVNRTGILFNEARKDILIDNYDDILSESILKLMTEYDNYVPEVNSSFHTYICDILPYRILTLLLSKEKEYLYMDNDKLHTQYVDMDYCINPLRLMLIENFKRIAI